MRESGGRHDACRRFFQISSSTRNFSISSHEYPASRRTSSIWWRIRDVPRSVRFGSGDPNQHMAIAVTDIDHVRSLMKPVAIRNKAA